MGTEQIQQWLDSCSEATNTKRKTKRKASTMNDTTPRPTKKQATGIVTPSASNSGLLRTECELSSALPSLPSLSSASSQDGTDRSSSPSKNNKRTSRSPQKRTAELNNFLDRPMYILVKEDERSSWEARYKNLVSSHTFQTLRACITNFRSPPIADSQLDRIFESFKRIPNAADENLWSDDVIYPCLRLAGEWSGQKSVRAIPVKSIGISHPALLSAPNADSKTRRVDYTIGVDVLHPPDDTVLKPILKQAGGYLSQSEHAQVYDKVLCSHLEIKVDAGTEEAHAQLKIWASAGFEKQRQLRRSKVGSSAQDLMAPLAPQPLWVWNRQQVDLIIAVSDWSNSYIWFLEEETFFLNKKDRESVAAVVCAIRNVMQWSASHYIDWFRADVLGHPELNSDRETQPEAS